MPKTFDLLLGIATVMLLLSLVVTAITHYLVSLCNLRGRYLRTGLASLLAHLDARIEPHAHPLATAMLKDPLVCETGGRMASFLHRAQLTRFCLGMAADVDTEEEDPQTYRCPAEALHWTLRAHGIAEPGAVLDRIALHALELERAQPELAELSRLETAIVSAAPAPFVAKIHACFDQTMDRVSARFTASVQVMTVAAALGMALFLQIDCIALVNHFAVEESLRGQVIKVTAPMERQASELVRVPASWAEWRRDLPGHAGGILLTAMLLSLGAPFWYSLLGGSLRLRPVLSARDDRERHARRSVPISLPASSTRLPESAEWHSFRENRYSVGRR